MAEKVLITGGAGFIGSHVADALSNRGYAVTILDVKESPYLRDDQKMVVGDILNEKFLTDVLHDKQIVYHFAGIADIDECAKRPVDTARFNILGTVKLLDACCRAHVRRFIFASSAYVYSDSGYFYRSSKQACESFIEDFADLHGLSYTCLRYGSLYGERADERNSIFRLIRQALNDGEIIYHGTGDEMREYIHVKDAAQISVDILDQNYCNQHIIITGNEKIKYGDLLEMIKEMLGNRVEIKVLPSERKAHYKITPYNFSPKVGRKLVNNPHIDMGQGLLQCMAEIYEAIHPDQKSEMGLLVNDKS